MKNLQDLVIEEVRKCAETISSDTQIEASTLLLDEGLLTSLELLQLVMSLEAALSTSIPLEQLTSENFATVEAICSMLERVSHAS